MNDDVLGLRNNHKAMAFDELVRMAKELSNDLEFAETARVFLESQSKQIEERDYTIWD